MAYPEVAAREEWQQPARAERPPGTPPTAATLTTTSRLHGPDPTFTD